MKNLKNYVNKEMTDESMNDFTRKLIHAKFDQEQKDEWAARLAEEQQVHRSPSTGAKVRRFRSPLIVAIAAAIAILMVAVPLFYSGGTSSHDQLADALLVETRLANPITRKGEIDESQMRLQMADAYNQFLYPQAIELGKQLVQSPTSQGQDFLFLGLSYLYEGQFEEAITHLSAVSQHPANGQNLEQESRWFLSLAYVKVGKLEEARNELRQIVEKEHWPSQKAVQLLDQLNQ
ncbi:MAG: hypothetical protein AAFV95_03490 [Bacteroidota bacterium]